MVQLLLAIIYLAFISLGLPDSLLGAAWPSMYSQFGVPVSYAGIVSMIIALGTIISSLQCDRLTRRLGTGKVTALSVLTTAVALLGFSFTRSYWVLCLWAIPYGLGAGCVDASLNNFVALHYTSDDPKDYDNIFRNAKFKISEADQLRLIEALKTLSAGEDLESAVNVDEALRYFTVQVFVMNWDSYLGRTGHNYFLYEEDGVLSILPWDYNLAFGTYALGMTNPIRDPNIIINYPIDTPAEGSVMLNRPLYHNLMKNNEYFARYHAYFDTLISAYFESGLFEERLAQIEEMIAPYVENDPTAYCSYEDHQLAVETFQTVCLLRAQSIRGQLDGSLPSTLREQSENTARVDASSVDLRDLGDFDDLTNAKEKQDAAMAQVCGCTYGGE